MTVKRIAIGSDHRGVQLKKDIVGALQAKGFHVNDFGAQSEESCDYPDYAVQVAEAVAKGKCERGIVICHSGIGMSIAANKVRGVRAALCHTVETAEFSRKHNDSNVLALGAGFVKPDTAREICLAWLAAEFEGGRHGRRVDKIRNYESHHLS